MKTGSTNIYYPKALSDLELEQSPYMLSPYAIWQLSLHLDENTNTGYDFKHLEEFKGGVDLELEGHAQFLWEHSQYGFEYRYKYIRMCDDSEEN